MTDIDIIIAIAKACGWTVTEEGWWINPEDTNGGVPHPPDYCHDLNAMHEAETWLSGHQWADYFDWLQKHGKAAGVRATAKERAEAFLRVKGLWKE